MQDVCSGFAVAQSHCSLQSHRPLQVIGGMPSLQLNPIGVDGDLLAQIAQLLQQPMLQCLRLAGYQFGLAQRQLLFGPSLLKQILGVGPFLLLPDRQPQRLTVTSFRRKLRRSCGLFQ